MAAKKRIKNKTIKPTTSDDDVLPSDQQEDIGDLDVQGNWYHGPVLWSTDWTTQTVIAQLDRGNINLSPRFQRRNAWSAGRKSSFIESLILGLPIPQIILAEDKNNKGSFIIIDGKQRLLSLRQFVSKSTDIEFNQLALEGLKDRTDLNDKTYEDLEGDPSFRTDLNTFENQTIRTVVIRGWTDERYLYSVFLRINTGSVQLSPQELRQALHPGPFTDFIDDFSVASKLLKNALRLKEPDFRMRDVELVLRYFAYRRFASQYKGNLKLFLDTALKKLNSAWKNNHRAIEQDAKTFEAALATTRQIFGENAEFRKWNGSTFEGQINRAVFDIMAYYFSDPKIAKSATNHAQKIVAAFKTLCETDAEFLSSVESTTKSIEANSIRFGAWAETLSDILKQKIVSPL